MPISSKPVKFGKFSKKKTEKDNQYIWAMKQQNKLSGADSRELKRLLEKATAGFLEQLYSESQNSE